MELFADVPSCRRLAVNARMSAACRWAQLMDYGLPVNIRSESNSLSLHSCWPKTDAFLKTLFRGRLWQSTAKGLNSVTEMIIQGILPWCFTPDFYSSNPGVQCIGCCFRAEPAPKKPLHGSLRQSERGDRP